MKKLLTILFLTPLFLYSQMRFEFTNVKVNYEGREKQVTADNLFIINYNGKGDVLHQSGGGNSTEYFQITQPLVVGEQVFMTLVDSNGTFYNLYVSRREFYFSFEGCVLKFY